MLTPRIDVTFGAGLAAHSSLWDRKKGHEGSQVSRLVTTSLMPKLHRVVKQHISCFFFPDAMTTLVYQCTGISAWVWNLLSQYYRTPLA